MRIHSAVLEIFLRVREPGFEFSDRAPPLQGVGQGEPLGWPVR